MRKGGCGRPFRWPRQLAAGAFRSLLQFTVPQQQEVGMRVMLGVLCFSVVLGAAGIARADEAQEGEKVFKKFCMACHTVEPGKNKIGPSLAGVVGRKAGTAPGFQYSDAMKNSGITWDEAALDKYLSDPKAAVPGNKMAFAGVKKPEERKDVIQFLETKKTASN
jgi:cytochrome c